MADGYSEPCEVRTSAHRRNFGTGPGGGADAGGTAGCLASHSRQRM